MSHWYFFAALLILSFNSFNSETISPTITPTEPVLRIPDIITATNISSIITASDIVSTQTIGIYDQHKNTSSLMYFAQNNTLLCILIIAVIIFAMCLCVLFSRCIKQRYSFNKVCKVENVQMQKKANPDVEAVYNDKKRYRRRVTTQSHISYSLSPNNSAMNLRSPTPNNYNEHNFNEIAALPESHDSTFQRRISTSFNITSLISHSSMNISPHLPIPITPINEYKVQPVSPMLSPLNLTNNNSVILSPPNLMLSPNDNNNNNNIEGLDKENITMAINEMFNNLDIEEKKEKEATHDEYNEYDIKDDEFVIKGDDDSEYHETKGSEIDIDHDNDNYEMDMSVQIDDDMISLMSVSNVSDEASLIIKKKNKKLLNLEIETIEENLCNDDDIRQQNTNVISL